MICFEVTGDLILPIFNQRNRKSVELSVPSDGEAAIEAILLILKKQRFVWESKYSKFIAGHYILHVTFVMKTLSMALHAFA